jgi:hypothetical protein
MRAPDLSEEIIGYRSWNLLPGGELVASVYSALWRPGTNEATCYYAHRIGSHRPAHTAPDERCGCGFYGLYGMDYKELRGRVTGLIAAWGDVCLHLTGFRAQCARIIAVDADYLPAHQLRGMRSFYGPELIICGATELEQIAESGEYGRLVSRELRPGNGRSKRAKAAASSLGDRLKALTPARSHACSPRPPSYFQPMRRL